MEGKSDLSSRDNICHPEIFPCGSTQAYQWNQFDPKSVSVLEQLIRENHGNPITLSCGKCFTCVMIILIFNVLFNSILFYSILFCDLFLSD